MWNLDFSLAALPPLHKDAQKTVSNSSQFLDLVLRLHHSACQERGSLAAAASRDMESSKHGFLQFAARSFSIMMGIHVAHQEQKLEARAWKPFAFLILKWPYMHGGLFSLVYVVCFKYSSQGCFNLISALCQMADKILHLLFQSISYVLICVWLFVIPWTVVHQALLVGFSSKNTGVDSLSFFRGFSWPRDRTWVSCIAGGLFTVWVTREAPKLLP